MSHDTYEHDCIVGTFTTIAVMCYLLLAFQDALDGSMRYDYGGPEPLNALANLRLSQSKPEEATKSAEEAFRRLGLCGGYSKTLIFSP